MVNNNEYNVLCTLEEKFDNAVPDRPVVPDHHVLPAQAQVAYNAANMPWQMLCRSQWWARTVLW
jgi:hypothetical protein